MLERRNNYITTYCIAWCYNEIFLMYCNNYNSKMSRGVLGGIKWVLKLPTTCFLFGIQIGNKVDLRILNFEFFPDIFPMRFNRM